MKDINLSQMIDDYISFWGTDKLRRWPEPFLSSIDAPAETKRFLAEIGLPLKVSYSIQVAPHALELPDVCGDKRFWALVYDYEVPLCLDSQADWDVAEVDDRLGERKRFVNSNATLFALCLTEYEKYWRSFSPESWSASLSHAEERMRLLDPRAFDNTENSWPLMIWAIRDEMR